MARLELRTPQEVVRDDLIGGQRRAQADKFEEVAGGPLDGINVLRRTTFLQVWDDTVRAYELPEPSEHSAAVVTPARVLVAIRCPNCGERADVAVYLTPRLVLEGQGGKLSAKAKGDPIDHLCGQRHMDDGVTPTDEVGTEQMDLPDDPTPGTDDDND